MPNQQLADASRMILARHAARFASASNHSAKSLNASLRALYPIVGAQKTMFARLTSLCNSTDKGICLSLYCGSSASESTTTTRISKFRTTSSAISSAHFSLKTPLSNATNKSSSSNRISPGFINTFLSHDNINGGASCCKGCAVEPDATTRSHAAIMVIGCASIEAVRTAEDMTPIIVSGERRY